MSALTEPMGVTFEKDEKPETVTARRRASNEELGLDRGPSAYEIKLYSAAGLEPPTE